MAAQAHQAALQLGVLSPFGLAAVALLGCTTPNKRSLVERCANSTVGPMHAESLAASAYTIPTLVELLDIQRGHIRHKQPSHERADEAACRQQKSAAETSDFLLKSKADAKYQHPRKAPCGKQSSTSLHGIALLCLPHKPDAACCQPHPPMFLLVHFKSFDPRSGGV